MNLGKYILNFLTDNKKTFIISLVLCQVIFLLFFFFSSRVFESRTDIMPNTNSSSQLGLNALSGLIPGNFQGQSKSPNIYSTIIKSKSFSKDLFKKTINVNGNEIVVYDWLLESYNLHHDNSEIEFEKLYRFFVKNIISVRYNKITNIVTIQAYTIDPFISQALLKISLVELKSRLKQYSKDTKAANKDFILSRISTIEDELIEIENRYINFLNQNSSTSSPSLNVAKKRIEREVLIKENLLKELAAELEINKLEVTRNNQVVIDVIDEPTLNLLKVYPKFSLLFIISLMVGFVIPFIVHSKKIFIDN